MAETPRETSIPIAEWSIGSLKAYHDMQISYERQISDERDKHWHELRKVDQKAIVVAQKNNQQHFKQLNENAERTIEERGHFVSIEAFKPFEENVIKQLTDIRSRLDIGNPTIATIEQKLAASAGRAMGSDKTVLYVVMATNFLFSLAGILIAVLK